MAYTPYESGGIVGPNQKALLGQLQGGTVPPPAPGAATASALPYTPPAAGDLSANAMENHTSTLGTLGGAASGASMGARVGSIVPGIGTGIGAGIGAGVGAIGGLLKGRTNDTKNAREQFAQSQGLPNSTALWQKLNESAAPDAASELQNRALNRIGKHDTIANDQWMQDVQAALSAGKPAPAAPAATAPAAVTDAAPAALQIPQGASGPEAAKYLMSQGMKGQELTDYLKAQGYEDNGLYYPDSGMYGFSGAYMGPDGNIVQRTPESPQGGSSAMQAPTAGLDSKLGGDPMAAIQQALQQYSGGANIQALLKQLGA